MTCRTLRKIVGYCWIWLVPWVATATTRCGGLTFFEPDELEYSAPDLYEKFVNSSDYDPAAHWFRRKEYGVGFESVTDESLLADAWHMRDDIVELASRRDVWLNIPDIDFVSRIRKLGVVVS